MAWVLGVLATDGCIRPSVRHPRTGYRSAAYVALTQKEPELLEKVLALMNSDASIYFRPARAQAGPVHYFDIAGQSLVDDLVRLGLSPRKSRTLQWPPELPAWARRHFIRGCWDGDGSFYLSGRVLCASFVSGSRAFITAVASALVAEGLSERPIYEENRKADAPSFKLRYLGAEAVQLGNLLYRGVSPAEYLSRKHEVFAAAARADSPSGPSAVGEIGSSRSASPCAALRTQETAEAGQCAWAGRFYHRHEPEAVGVQQNSLRLAPRSSRSLE
jgi:hypothetical protein